MRLDWGTICQNAGRLENMFELTDVARPGVRLNERSRLGRETGGILKAAAGKEPFHQMADVPSLTQRWQGQDETANPIIEILAEPPFGTKLLKRLVSCRQKPNIEINALGAAKRRHLPAFEHLQQSCLGRERHVADFIKQQRAAIGRKQ